MLGSYNFPADVMLSANFEHQSGEVFARQVRFTGGETIPKIVLNVEPIGSQRLPNLNLLTFRVEKGTSGCGRRRSGGPTRPAQRVEREHGNRGRTNFGGQIPAAR